MFKLLSLIFLLVPSLSHALAIVSDPWPPADAQQPTICGYIHVDATPPANTLEVPFPVEQMPDGVRCNMNIDNINPGPHTFKVFAKNDVERAEVDFNFTKPVDMPPPSPLRPPVNLRCDPICKVVP